MLPSGRPAPRARNTQKHDADLGYAVYGGYTAVNSVVMATTTSESAKALMSFSSGDEDALLQVLPNYFTCPDGEESDDWVDDGDRSTGDDV